MLVLDGVLDSAQAVSYRVLNLRHCVLVGTYRRRRIKSIGTGQFGLPLTEYLQH